MENNNVLKFCKVRDVKSPVRGTSVAAGIDFFIPSGIDSATWSAKTAITGSYPLTTFDDNGNISTITLDPGQSVMIPSGIKMKIPHGFAMVMMNKSGVGAKKHLDVLAAVIDEDYEGEVHLNLVNSGTNTQTISAGDKIVQGLILPINYAVPVEVDNADVLYADSTSARGEGGFGSTGTR